MNNVTRNLGIANLQQLRSFYPKGTILFNERDERDCAYIIEKGEVEISVTKKGKKVPLVRLGAGEVFGETALLGAGKRTAAAVTTQDCEVYRIFPSILRDRIMHLDPLVGLLLSLLINRYRQWRYVSPEVAAEIQAVDTATEDFRGIDKADDFLKDLNTQKEIALKELRMAQEISEAVTKDEMSPYFQPILSLADKKLVGFEALIRWKHPQKGLIPPIEFVSVAERTNTVWQLDMMMLRQCCRKIKDLQTAGGLIGRKLYVSVNLSGVHFDSEEIVAQVMDTIRESGVDPAHIVLEITESALMGNPAMAEKALRALKSSGVTIALDDFGTGYSSLSYLHHFSIDILKIDRSFVNDIHNKSSKSLDVVRAIVSLAKTFNLRIIAEGIEQEEDMRALAELGCDNGQGYFFSKPLPFDQALAFVKESSDKYG